MNRFALRAASTAALSLLVLSTPSFAQGPGFDTPGTPNEFPRFFEPPPDQDGNQVTRFSNFFNPAFFFVVDAAADWQNAAGRSADDGLDTSLRTLEIGAQTWVDPNAWAYFIGATEGEELAIEEAAILYTGFENNSMLRAGRFFIDFGKQMQVHVHELRTTERPLALRAFLGDEVKGDGIQWDHWTPVGDETVMRWSIGAFQNLFPEEDAFFEDPAKEVQARKDAEDLGFTGRLTAFRDLTDNTTIQVGASARVIPDFTAEFVEPGTGFTGDIASGLSSEVYGADVSWAWNSQSGLESLTLGGEFLASAGDNGFVGTGTGTPIVLDDTVTGWFAFAHWTTGLRNSFGLQYSQIELPDQTQTDVSETELYWTRRLSEFQRLRFAAIGVNHDDAASDSIRFVIQYTASLGAHAHGINW